MNCVAALPDGVHFVVGYSQGVRHHVDGTLVTFEGHTGAVFAVAVTPDGSTSSAVD